MNGRSPGFASFVLYLPDEQLTVVVLGNIYSSATTSLGYDLAAITLGLPYKNFEQQRTKTQGVSSSTTFRFGPDFYQPNVKLTLLPKNSDLFLQWPAETTALVPTGPDKFVDRWYWVEVQLERNNAGQLTKLIFDGFSGSALSK
jgi:hypothetical protein